MKLPEHVPNWTRIVTSDVWREELVPLLDALIGEAQGKLETCELRDVRKWQGIVGSLKAFRDTPQTEIDFSKAYRRHLAGQGLIDPEDDNNAEDADSNERGRTERRPLWSRRWFRRSGN